MDLESGVHTPLSPLSPLQTHSHHQPFHVRVPTTHTLDPLDPILSVRRRIHSTDDVVDKYLTSQVIGSQLHDSQSHRRHSLMELTKSLVHSFTGEGSPHLHAQPPPPLATTNEENLYAQSIDFAPTTTHTTRTSIQGNKSHTHSQPYAYAIDGRRRMSYAKRTKRVWGVEKVPQLTLFLDSNDLDR